MARPTLIFLLVYGQLPQQQKLDGSILKNETSKKVKVFQASKYHFIYFNT